jgi:hypothetical protein
MVSVRPVVAAVGRRWRSGWTSRRTAMLTMIAAALVTVSFAGPTLAQMSPTSSGSFNPPVINVGGTSDLTFEVTNPNPPCH